MTADYLDRLHTEIENFRNVENVHDLPDIFHVWSQKFVRPKIETVLGIPAYRLEEFYAKYILQYAADNPSEVVTIASVGAGNADFELRIGGMLKNSGLDRFRFQCIDINPAMLSRGREAALNEELSAHFEFLEMDVSQWSPAQPVAIVMANHSLHHIEQLESTFANIKEAIGEKGYFLTCDMIGRNGHMRWPEALEIVHDIWKRMPERYKYNHQMKRFEELYENLDCSTESFEGIRAQDILPLLLKVFRFEVFVAFGNLPDIFVERSFGHNFSPQNQEDVAFIDQVGELNDRLISEGKIKPTQMMAVMRASKSNPCKHYLSWTPEFCVRYPPVLSTPKVSVNLSPVALPLPITGCGIQHSPARGFWADGWIARNFEVNIRLTEDEDLEWIVVDGYLPKESQHEPELCLQLNGKLALVETAVAGLFSLRVQTQAARGELLALHIVSSTTYCPARNGNGIDNRELVIVLREIRLVPTKALQQHDGRADFQGLISHLLRKILQVGRHIRFEGNFRNS